MKNLKLLYLLFSGLMLLGGCSNVLDEIEPTDKITAEELFTDPNGAKAYLANLYRKLPIEDYMFMPGTDNSGFHNPNGNIGILFLSQITDIAVQTQWGEQDPGYVLRADYFNQGYSTIRDINLFKSIYPELEGISDADKEIYTGESAFCTAFVYFYLARKFGGVPIIPELQEFDPSNPEELVVPRSTEKETWEYVMAQCDTAVKYLPSSTIDRRATKFAALALKSRAALHAASIAKFGHLAPLMGEAVDKGLAGMQASDADYFYQESIEASLQIMDPGSGHGLYKPNPVDRFEAESNFRSIFTNPNETDGEAIFIKGIVREGDGFASSLNVLTEPFQTGGSGRISPALDFVDVFEDYTDEPNLRSDAPILTKTNENFATDGFDNLAEYIEVDKDNPENLFNGIAYNDPKKAKDARLWASVILPGTEWKGNRIIIQGGLIKQDGSVVFRVDETAPGLDGNMYRSLGGSKENVSGFWPDAAFSTTGFLFRKMISEDDAAQYNRSTLDFIVFRYSEILLNYAEAVLESGSGDLVQATNALNAVRKRAAHTNEIPLTRENIRKERMAELAFENLRVWDLIRWRVYHELYTNYSHQVLVPMLDLRQNPPKMIYVRRTTQGISLNGPANYAINQYYEDVPRNDANNMIQNP